MSGIGENGSGLVGVGKASKFSSEIRGRFSVAESKVGKDGWKAAAEETREEMNCRVVSPQDSYAR